MLRGFKLLTLSEHFRLLDFGPFVSLRDFTAAYQPGDTLRGVDAIGFGFSPLPVSSDDCNAGSRSDSAAESIHRTAISSFVATMGRFVAQTLAFRHGTALRVWRVRQFGDQRFCPLYGRA